MFNIGNKKKGFNQKYSKNGNIVKLKIFSSPFFPKKIKCSHRQNTITKVFASLLAWKIRLQGPNYVVMISACRGWLWNWMRMPQPGPWFYPSGMDWIVAMKWECWNVRAYHSKSKHVIDFSLKDKVFSF